MSRTKSWSALGAAALLSLSLAGSAGAQQTCGGTYTVKAGDSLSAIADRLYKNAGMWSTIHSNNFQAIGPKANNIRVGQRLRMACVNGLPTGLPGGTVVTAQAAQPTQSDAADVQRVRAIAAQRRDAGTKVRILAGDGYQPFSDRLLLNSGMMSDLVNRAFASVDLGGQHKFYWVNDRSAHLDPMLAEGMADIAYPWIKPKCEAGAGACADYIYSDPMFEMLVLLFTKSGAALKFDSADDLAGHRLCRPQGLQLEALKGSDADWLRNNRVTIMQPATAEECFTRLVRGETDYVALNEFTGRMVVKDMGLTDQVEILAARPLSIESLHAVAHRSNPQAEALIGAFNEGLAAIRESGEYRQTVETHLSSIWAGF